MRLLPAIVVVMGILIVAGVGLLVWGLANLSNKDGAPSAQATGGAAMPPAAASAAFGTVPLGLPGGCDIAGASAGDGRLVVRTSCGELRILDLATGAPLGTVTR